MSKVRCIHETLLSTTWDVFEREEEDRRVLATAGMLCEQFRWRVVDRRGRSVVVEQAIR